MNDQISQPKELADAGRWEDLLELARATANPDADLDYYEGLALSHLQRWEEARKAFLAGRLKQPQDKRFPVELAGVAFKQKHLTETVGWLRTALRLDRKDPYVNDFLAATYFLQNNLEAALKYWNRIEKPRIDEVRVDPKLRVNAVLLDHAFAFSPADTLRLRDFLATQSRLQNLGIFPSYRLTLPAQPDENFDVQFNAQEKNGFGNGKIQALLGVFSGLPYGEVTPQYFNIGGTATNWLSLLRWDAQKRRASSELSGPFLRSPQWRFRLGIDLREENWEIRQSFTGVAPALAGLNLRREALAAELKKLNGSRSSWTAGVQFSHRNYRDVFAGEALTPSLLTQGYELAENAGIHYSLLRVPEHRLTVDGELSGKAGRLWPTASPEGLSADRSFATIQAALKSIWLPRSQRDDYETHWDLRSADTAGRVPFDDLFMLGMERDNDLWLRGHIGTRDGRKGSAPLGTRYLLSNWETDKNVYRNGIVTLKLGPFIDSGAIAGASTSLSSNKWLWDTGIEAKVSVLGVGVSLVYGKDLRTGNNAFYTAVGRQ